MESKPVLISWITLNGNLIIIRILWTFSFRFLYILMKLLIYNHKNSGNYSKNIYMHNFFISSKYKLVDKKLILQVNTRRALPNHVKYLATSVFWKFLSIFWSEVLKIMRIKLENST